MKLHQTFNYAFLCEWKPGTGSRPFVSLCFSERRTAGCCRSDCRTRARKADDEPEMRSKLRQAHRHWDAGVSGPLLLPWISLARAESQVLGCVLTSYPLNFSSTVVISHGFKDVSSCRWAERYEMGRKVSQTRPVVFMLRHHGEHRLLLRRFHLSLSCQKVIDEDHSQRTWGQT